MIGHVLKTDNKASLQSLSSEGTTVRNRFYFKTETVFETGRTGNVQYAPKQPAPILDVVLIFTAFVAALIFTTLPSERIG